jgi:hypothetical protein
MGPYKSINNGRRQMSMTQFIDIEPDIGFV